MKNYLILIVALLILSSCTKSNLNPQCWGGCKDATFFYAPCSGITGYLVFKDKPNDTIMITKDIPKRFKTDKIDVFAKIKEVETPIITANCDVKGLKFAEIKCIKRK